jgi:hypothetical protein
MLLAGPAQAQIRRRGCSPPLGGNDGQGSQVNRERPGRPRLAAGTRELDPHAFLSAGVLVG